MSKKELCRFTVYTRFRVGDVSLRFASLYHDAIGFCRVLSWPDLIVMTYVLAQYSYQLCSPDMVSIQLFLLYVYYVVHCSHFPRVSGLELSLNGLSLDQSIDKSISGVLLPELYSIATSLS